MQAPDYTHWHGTYDLAKNWNSKFVPERKEIIARYKGTPAAAKDVEALEAGLKEVLNSSDHNWSLNKEDPKKKEQRLQRQKEFAKRYK
jgi:hydroxylamine dehydrogenase